MKNVKTSKEMERHFKGIANHYRISILLLLNSSKEVTLEGIVEALGANFKTISEHTRRLAHAGLLNKKYRGREVLHSLSPYGKQIVSFIKSFQHS